MDSSKRKKVLPAANGDNSTDASSYSAFIRDNDIRKGIIIADKGLSSQQDKGGTVGETRPAFPYADQTVGIKQETQSEQGNSAQVKLLHPA